ncbi:hypothetical protein CMO93_04645 [Candidatus Woesearchaeota archaeon]|nr:hypothetical protein [Candidatus Woesearchaeota archaeon]|tara:strand:- start:388 stop:1122 length:735 start_codon:yes stop_codon:yes gene_type:complete
MKNKHTLIIGGTKGIGLEVAKSFSREKHTVSVLGRSPLTTKNKYISCWNLDLVNNIKNVSKVLDKIIEKNGKISNLIFLQRYRGKESVWDNEIKVSLTSTKLIIENLIDKFDETGDKSIVIMGSLASSLIAEEQPLSYHVVKSALNQMVRYFAVNLGPKGIRVNCVSAGSVIKEESKKYYLSNKQLQSLYKKITPLGRMCTSKDIANTIYFLCSSNASFITGQNIAVDGGVSLQMHESLARKLK